MSLKDFRLNHGGMDSLLKGSVGHNAVEGPAEAALSAAVAGAPVETGAYRGSLHIEWDTTDRAVARVVADVNYSHVVEANTGNLARALDAAG